jgi:diguanylate cyclase (GGDEF)-like protein/PAS domain S-box-containing protein
VLTGLENKSVRKKLIFTSVLVTGLAILVGMVISIVEDIKYTRQNTQEQLTVLADVVAANTAPALIFNDYKAAESTLQLLKANKIVSSATIFDERKKVFATYTNNIVRQASWMSQYPHLINLDIERPIEIKEQQSGLLVVSADITSIWNALITQWIAKFIVLSAIFLVSYLVLRSTSDYVLGPIQRLANAIREIIESGDYSLRVEKMTTDELGELTEEFNLMLSQIEDRDNQLQQSNEALAQVQEPIILRDADLRCQYINPAFTALFGYTFEELEGKTFSLRVDEDKGPQLTQEEIYNIAKNEGVYRGETLRKTKSGDVIPMQRHVSPIKDKVGNLKGYVTVLTDISDKKRAEEIIWRQANFDTLTGLPNRFMFMHRLKQELSKINRSRLPLALMFLDLDHFKEINDTLGHDVGDLLLKEASSRILSCLRGTDTVGYMDSMENVARLGGDEFTIILSEIKESNGAEIVAKRVLDKLSQPFQFNGELVNISASIGIVETYPNESINAETLIKYADIAMYESKQHGRNRYSKFSQSMLHETQKRRRLINDIYHALKNNEFQVVYQPIVDIQTNTVVKAEALIRWHHPTEGLVNPNDFISVAEDAGLIVEIGDWVFKQAAQQVAIWRQTIDKNFQISVNKSPVQLNAMDHAKLNWSHYLSELGLPGESIIVEITEGVFLNKNTLVTDKLLAFRDAGVQVALDDFGTGYSSLSYLLKFDIDYIKIDQSFVQNLTINSEDMVLCEAMIMMAHKLGIKVVAEGVETQEQLDILAAAGCNYGQGYLLAKPLSAKAFERICQRKKDEDLLVVGY